MFGIGDPVLVDANADRDAVDAPPDIAITPDDLDGDGVLNDNDNCPTIANPDQRDFDGDHHGDICDHCPHLASADDPDADGDGIGDACDPRPAMAGDTRVAWFGFYDSADLAGWSIVGGTWSVVGGRLVQPSTAGTASINAPMLTAALHLQVVTELDLVALGASPNMDVCSAVSGPRFYCCNLDANNLGAVVMEDTGSVTETTVAWPPGTFNAGDSVVMTQNTSSGNACNATQALLNSPSAANAAVGGAGVFGFYTHQMGMAVRYLFVVAIGT